MTARERRGLEMMLRASPYNGPGRAAYSYAARQAFRTAKAWIERQLKIDARRRSPRGSYRKSR